MRSDRMIRRFKKNLPFSVSITNLAPIASADLVNVPIDPWMLLSVVLSCRRARMPIACSALSVLLLKKRYASHMLR